MTQLMECFINSLTLCPELVEGSNHTPSYGYVRYRDDWVVIASTRWKLRAAIRAVNQVMANLFVRQHPDKTIIGRIARQTLERCREHVSRLYEQGAAVGTLGAGRTRGNAGGAGQGIIRRHVCL